MVGAGRFELPASWSRTKRATRLRYAPRNLNQKQKEKTKIRIRATL